MTFLILIVIEIVVEISLFEIIQAIVKIKHKPYVKLKDENTAAVYIFQMSRTEKGSYAEYLFRKKNGRWKYIINKDFNWSFGILMLVVICGIIISFCVKGMPPFINVLQLFIALFLAVGLAFVYYPLKAYCLLKMSHEKKH